MQRLFGFRRVLVSLMLAGALLVEYLATAAVLVPRPQEVVTRTPALSIPASGGGAPGIQIDMSGVEDKGLKAMIFGISVGGAWTTGKGKTVTIRHM